MRRSLGRDLQHHRRPSGLGSVKHAGGLVEGIDGAGRDRASVRRRQLQDGRETGSHAATPAIRQTASRSASGPPTLPGKMPSARSGQREVGPQRHRGTPGSSGPRMRASLTSSPRVATSLLVMPPLAIIQAGLVVTPRTTATSAAETAAAMRTSAAASSPRFRSREVTTTAVVPAASADSTSATSLDSRPGSSAAERQDRFHRQLQADHGYRWIRTAGGRAVPWWWAHAIPPPPGPGARRAARSRSAASHTAGRPGPSRTTPRCGPPARSPRRSASTAPSATTSMSRSAAASTASTPRGGSRSKASRTASGPSPRTRSRVRTFTSRAASMGCCNRAFGDPRAQVGAPVTEDWIAGELGLGHRHQAVAPVAGSGFRRWSVVRHHRRRAPAAPGHRADPCPRPARRPPPGSDRGASRSLRLTTAHVLVPPRPPLASASIRPMARARSAASPVGRLRLLVSRNASGSSAASSDASRSTDQRVSTGTSRTVWVPVGSSSSAMTRVAAPRPRILGQRISGPYPQGQQLLDRHYVRHPGASVSSTSTPCGRSARKQTRAPRPPMYGVAAAPPRADATASSRSSTVKQT